MTPEQLEEALERAKAIIRVELAVVAHRAEGLTASQSAQRLGISEATVEHLRRHLQLTRAQGGRGPVRPSGRSREVRLVVEVRR